MSETVVNFADLGLSAPLLTGLADVGYETPSPIQAACIPHLLAGLDILGEAQTGTGKTAAFALPLLEKLDLSDFRPQVLVLTPTRELAIQVSEAFQKYARYLRDFHVLPIYGGQSMVVQLRQLQRGAHVIVGTPGRVMDHLERKSLSLDGLKALVLDEADEMLRMGFIDDVEWILEHTPSTRQTALFSATMPDPIRRVARKHLRDPQEVKIRSATSTVDTISQRYWQVRGVNKLDALTRILEVEENFDAAIVFVRTKTATVELADKLEARGYAAAPINGDMTQGLRERAIEQLKTGALDLLVATDVAARGIDVSRVSHVINYDIPYDTEAYVHRIGRTGRAGRAGNAILFVAPREMGMLRAIERATRQPITPIALPTREAVADRRVAQFKQQVLDAIEAEDMEFFSEVVSELEDEHDLSMSDIASALAYLVQKERPLKLEETGSGWDIATAPASAATTRRPEDRGERGDRGDRHPRERPSSPQRQFQPGKPVRYRIEVGRNQNATPKEIVGAIANEGGIEGRLIGQINLYDDYSTVELPLLPADLLSTLQRTRVRQLPLNIRLLGEGENEAPPRGRSSERPEWRGEERSRPPFREERAPRPYGGASGGTGETARPPRPGSGDESWKRPSQRSDAPPRSGGYGREGGDVPPRRSYDSERPARPYSAETPRAGFGDRPPRADTRSFADKPAFKPKGATSFKGASGKPPAGKPKRRF